MRLIRKIRQKQAVCKRAAAIKQFIADVDHQAQIHGLDPELTELVVIKENAGVIVDSRTQNGYLADINPHKDYAFISETETIVIHERMFGGVLYPWTIVQHHCGDIFDLITKIVVDASGMHFYNERDLELVCYTAAACNPHRMADDGSRLRNATFCIKHHTGWDIDWHALWNALSITLTYDEQNGWNYIIDSVPANT